MKTINYKKKPLIVAKMKVLLYICVLNNKKKVMEKKEKKVVQIEIGDDVKKLTIEGVDKDEQVVMHEELSDDELDEVSGGICWHLLMS